MPLALIVAIVVFVYIHESMHFLAFKLFKIEFETKIIWKYKLPVAYYVYSPYFNQPIYKMNKTKQQQYCMIAILPYLVVFPIAYFMTTLNIIQMTIIGLTVMVTHIVNLPLEFVKV